MAQLLLVCLKTRRTSHLLKVLEGILVHSVHLSHARYHKVHDRAACSHRAVLLTR